ncbi:Glyoxalase-like domain-containing protein [Salinibacillus kushneri]|uniref:Glyoxalase-like domain-containing protein n=1 Tax=Salinibacillus kushneri TaxID=237682 RepID=A0A1I0BG59_9BACI|nr:VOC family protein [Salinibacillus kushneri]SET05780.1 Glyoxalase-like domain-containing protein [Salinibacillus kushneri]
MLAFDHLVVFSKSIEKEVQDFTNQYDLIFSKGGNHEPWGTYNHVAFMSNNSYIEWLGINDSNKAKASDNPLIQHAAFANDQNHEGPIQFALRTQQMDNLIHHYQKNGVSYKGPFPGSRKKPDGTTLSWRMLFPEYEAGQNVKPFLIEWEKEGNHPPNQDMVNSVPFTAIQIGVSSINQEVEAFTNIYKLPEPEFSQNDYGQTIAEWPLENGDLQLVKGNHLNARFGHMIYSS